MSDVVERGAARGGRWRAPESIVRRPEWREGLSLMLAVAAWIVLFALTRYLRQ